MKPHPLRSILPTTGLIALIGLACTGCMSSSSGPTTGVAYYAAPVAGMSKSRSRSVSTADSLMAVPCAAPCAGEPFASGGWTGRVGNTESYAPIVENAFVRTASQPVSTFGADVDTASYANVRRLIRSGDEVPPDAVRLEEMVNYFPYDYPLPAAGQPFAVSMETAECPWKPGDRLLKVAFRARDVAPASRPAANLVFLVDVSGSMDQPDKLPLVKKGLKFLTGSLRPEDRISMITYAGASGMVLAPTPGSEKGAIRQAIDRLQAGGSTNGASGIQLAYQTAAEHFVRGGVNRVILATDGDFNVGITSRSALESLITRQAKTGVFLSVLGFGMGNLKDSTLEMLADRGNGNYAYIDSVEEARKVLDADASGTLLTVAKDVKFQLAWNPSAARRYRLLGYENRVMANADFNNDRKDSGDVGSGQRVTVLYQYEPAADEGTLTTLRIRHKLPESSGSTLAEFTCPAAGHRAFASAGPDFRFAASVAAFGMMLRGSVHAGEATRESVLSWASGATGSDPGGLRREFPGLVRKARLPGPVRSVPALSQTR